MDNKRKIGSRYESLAAEYLIQKGYRIVMKNYRSPFGEIDLIGYHAGYLVFIEVKYRKNSRYGLPQDAVDIRKQHVIRKTADYYRMEQGLSETVPVRFDVVAILGNEIVVFKDAF